MRVTQSQLLAVGMMAIVLAVGYAQYAFQQRDKAEERKNLVDGCVRQTTRAVFSSVGWNEVVRARKERGDTKRAIERAAAVEQALMETVPPPAGMKPGDPRMFQTATVEYLDGRVKLVLTGSAARLLRRGCERVYP